MNITVPELAHIMNCLESVQAEIEQLEYDNEWYSSDSTDLVLSSLEILHGYFYPVGPDEEEDQQLELLEDYI
jgi:hypothetical protein